MHAGAVPLNRRPTGGDHRRKYSARVFSSGKLTSRRTNHTPDAERSNQPTHAGAHSLLIRTHVHLVQTGRRRGLEAALETLQELGQRDSPTQQWLLLPLLLLVFRRGGGDTSLLLLLLLVVVVAARSLRMRLRLRM